MDDIFHPNIFILAYVLFIIVGVITRGYTEYTPHVLLFFYVAYGMLCFYIGTRITVYIKREYILLITAIVLGYYSFMLYSYTAFLIIPVLLALMQLDFKKYSKKFYFAGITLLLLNFIYIRDIPLLNPDVKREALTIVFACGYALLYIGIAFLTAKKFNLPYFIAAFVVLFFYGYRTYLLILVISTAVVLYYTKRVTRYLWLVPVGIITLFVLNIAFLQFSSQQWHLNFVELIAYRTSYTTSVLNTLVEKAGLWGHTHDLWLHPITGTIVGKIVTGSAHNTTSTILGPLILAFGVLGIPVMVFFGAVLGTLREKMNDAKKVLPYYAILLSITLVCVDISPFPLVILSYLVALYKVS